MPTKHLTFPGIYLTDADTGKRVAVHEFHPGDALVPAQEPQPILGYTYHHDGLTVYVNGSMPLAMRSAAEENRTDQETWLVDELPAGIREIDWTHCRREYYLKKAA